MLSHRKLIGLSLAFLLLVMQTFWFTHRLEHDLSPNTQEEAACEFCLAMCGMGSAVPALERAVAVIPSSEYCSGYASILRVAAEPIQPRQQGPPRFS
jgi:hypothetical protein